MGPPRTPMPVNDTRAGLVFVFSSQGGQWPGMGRQLCADSSVAREVVGYCDHLIAERLGWSLSAEITCAPEQSRIQCDPYFVQPALTALQIAVGCSLESAGLRPNAVAGLSMGEVAGLHLAGALDLPAAMDVVCAQARLTRCRLPRGGMAIVGLASDEVQSRLPQRCERVWVAVELGPDATVLSGELLSLNSCIEGFRRSGVRVAEVSTGYAFHSPEMQPLRDTFLGYLRGLRATLTRAPAYSSVTGNTLGDTIPNADYWWAIIANKSPFAETLRRLIVDGYRTFVEIGPHPMLADAIASASRAEGVDVQYTPGMQRGKEDLGGFTEAVRRCCALHTTL